MKRKVFFSAAVCLLALSASLFSGCAVMLKGGRSQGIRVNSDPTGAQFYVDGNLAGTTPCELELALKQGHLLEFRKEGYVNQTVLVANKLGAGWVALYLFLAAPLSLTGLLTVSETDSRALGLLLLAAGVLPVTNDAATGAWNSFDLKEITVNMEKKP